MIKREPIWIVISVIGIIMFVISLSIFYLYSMPQIPVVTKFIFGLLSILRISFLPTIVMPLLGIVTFIFGLLSIFGILSFQTIAMPVVGIIIFVFGLFSFLRGISPRLSFLLILFVISGFIYLLSSFFLFRLKSWARKIIINYSIILLFCFIPLFVYFFMCGAWQNFFAGALAFSLLPYIIFPIFFIISLTRLKV